jgi:hypothetical protein
MLMYQQASNGEKTMSQIARELKITRSAVQDICRRVALALGEAWEAPRKAFTCQYCGNAFFGTGSYYGDKARYCEAHRGLSGGRHKSDKPVAVEDAGL